MEGRDEVGPRLGGGAVWGGLGLMWILTEPHWRWGMDTPEVDNLAKHRYFITQIYSIITANRMLNDCVSLGNY